MSKIRPGNKQNALLNKEWGHHIRKKGKQNTATIRRNVDKSIIKKDKNEL